jgi:hypothetical protein
MNLNYMYITCIISSNINRKNIFICTLFRIINAFKNEFEW